MTKNDFNLIHAFIAKGNPKFELNYALVSDDGIYATDTRKAIKYHIPMLGCEDMLASKIVIKSVATSLDKDGSGSIGADGVVVLNDFEQISLDNRLGNFKFPDLQRIILDTKLEYYFELNTIDDIHFELTQKECFIDDVHLIPIISYADCNKYKIFFNKQKGEADTTNTGMVKIVGIHNVDDEVDAIKFEAVIMGREFKTQAKEQLLLDL